ncbi:sigma 54-interacting transcriptional regulator [Denitratisoma oestradiolicum]|uniref:Putative DNA-binding response regulator in two-component system n=1 Tax=Denitratisoma oestradiolicum TaxID=311182 RepID=A0A6S6XQN0_9PROT|nr:sigma 54-interacting transcriptional regulator [Denitratisoma oestradiolicum]TWO79229.1 two-component system response regulator GlrR [Denitratisoma oestradiolicum]CAB1368231.1 putative DNA-binding response regulator in two-component system [Denitratisoma oestradiolicum]
MNPARLLLVDDDKDLLRLLTIRLEAAGYAVSAADSGERAMALLAVERPQVVITDMRMPGMDGTALFEAIHREYPTLPVIMLTAHGTIPDAVEATRRGLFGYLTKPYEPQALLAEVARAVKVSGADDDWQGEIISRNPAMEALLAQARLVAAGEARVLIRGESGTGKELLAQAIHRASPRRDGPFLAVNCAAIPEPLLESELFGHLKGSFTGAVRDHRGLFQEAEGGTLLLDEIGDMPLPLQVKLLRVLEERQVRPVGSTRSVAVDVRILSATHRRLEDEIGAGRFREDLFYRLNVVTLALPSLDERRDDIPLLATHFLKGIGERYGRTLGGFAPEALELLTSAAWPGNIRQLYNVVEQAVALCTGKLIPATLIQNALASADGMASLEEARARFERDYLGKLLRMTGGNVSQAARLAKRNRTEFYKLLQRHQLDPALFK